jgi:DNA-binding NarL/FixJ family response regulator
MTAAVPPPVTLLVCDDHRLVTDALSIVIDRDPGLRMVHEPVSRPEEAIDICREHEPDVVLMDVSFEGRMSGIEATRRIKDTRPKTNVVILTGHPDGRVLVEAVEAGASGFINKSEMVDVVLETVKAAAKGEVLVDALTLSRAVRDVARERETDRDAGDRLASLTPREREVLGLCLEGCRNEEIAARLHIGVQTVQTHVHNVLRKVGARSKSRQCHTPCATTSSLSYDARTT